MLPLEQPDRIQIAFDDHRLVANAGPILPVTLAHHLGLGELVDNHVDLRDAPGRANVGDKLLTLVASALAGGDCIDAADTLRTGGTEQALDCVVKAIHPGGLSEEFPVGPRAPAGPGEPSVAGGSLGGWSDVPYEIAHWHSPTVHQDFHVQFQRIPYFVPSHICRRG